MPIEVFESHSIPPDIVHRGRKGRRAFYWVSSIDPTMEPHLDLLSKAMTRFYAKPATRLAYQEMIDSDTAAQPEIEGALCKAVLSGKPSAILEIGCGSGRIYARLQQGWILSVQRTRDKSGPAICNIPHFMACLQGISHRLVRRSPGHVRDSHTC
jgi:hypothetical protein